MIRRREFITLLGGAAAWAQQGDRVRRIGWLMWGDENDPWAKPYVSAFTQALAGLGWNDGRNVRIDLRWFGDDINRIRALARELVGRTPSLGGGNPHGWLGWCTPRPRQVAFYELKADACGGGR
jgi:putative ABC transport system substrate-binding protein